MAEAKKKTETQAYVPTRTAETAVGSLSIGELVYLVPDERVQGLVDAGYLMTQKDYLDQTDPVVVTEMERQGVSAREGGPRSGE